MGTLVKNVRFSKDRTVVEDVFAKMGDFATKLRDDVCAKIRTQETQKDPEAVFETRQFRAYDLPLGASWDDALHPDAFFDECDGLADWNHFETQKRKQHNTERLRQTLVAYHNCLEAQNDRLGVLARSQLDKALKDCGFYYGSLKVSEEDFNLVVKAYVRTIEDGDDARTFLAFMNDDDLSISIRLTAFYKIAEGKNTIRDIRNFCTITTLKRQVALSN